MVRLSEVVNQLRRRISEGKNFAQNPVQMVWQSGRKFVMLAYGKLSLPTGNPQNTSPTKLSSDTKPDQGADDQGSGIVVENIEKNAASKQRLQTATAAGKKLAVNSSKHSGQENLEQRNLGQAQLAQSQRPSQPTLQPGERLQGGWWGVYTIKSCMYAQDWIRCYDGLQDNGSDSIWIYEYCFDQDNWSADEIDERKRRFKNLVDLNLRLGEGSDFRLVRPKDIIKPAGNRVYLITRSIPHSVTLNNLLQQQSTPWTRTQIERFLNQVLQSLQYLQTYLVNWPGDRWEQKLSHGNLSGDCLWVRLPEGRSELNGAAATQSPFFVYLDRFPLWEHLCWPQQTPIAQHNDELGSLNQDLHALAHITFTLVRGYQSDDNPADLDLWPEDTYIRALYPYVLQLLGQGDNNRFKSIDTAISGLQKLPETYYSPKGSEVLPTPATESTNETSPVLLTLPLLLLGGGVLLSLIVWLAGIIKFEKPILACSDPCRLEDVGNGGLSEPIRYGLENGSSWEKAFFSRLTSPLDEPQPTSQFGGLTALQEALQKRDQTFSLEKARNVRIPKNSLLDSLRTDSLDVALMQNLPRLPSNLEKRVVGYDGITIFVTHSNAQRQDSIPKRLRGRISLQKLRQILLDVNATLDGAKVQIYWSEDDITASLLRDFLFQKETDKQAFNQRRNKEMRTSPTRFSQQPSRQKNLYERMLRDFEINAQIGDEDIIGIGFNRISQLIGQCSVYPLTLMEGDRTYDLFVNADGVPIDQTTDLCGDKGTYWVNDEIFPTPTKSYPLAYGAEPYPLAYEMAVVYYRPDDVAPCGRYTEGCAKGQLLVDKLLTPEGQYLLSEVGLVPAELSISDIREMMWAPMAKGGEP